MGIRIRGFQAANGEGKQVGNRGSETSRKMRKGERRKRGLEVREREEGSPPFADSSESVEIKTGLKVGFDYIPYQVVA